MAYNPHWIDAPNTTYFRGDAGGPGLALRKIGSRLLSVNMIREAVSPFPVGYSSDDAGSTWTYRNTLGLTGYISGGTEISNSRYSHLFPVGSRLCLVSIGRGGTGNDVDIEFANPTSLEWEDHQTLAIMAQDRPTSYAGSFAGVRPDGTIIIVVVDTATSSPFYYQAHVYKWDTGTVTSLGVIADSTPFYQTYINNGFIDSAGNVHLFFVSEDLSDTGYSQYQHASVAADDTISSLHLIEADVEFNWWSNTNFGTGCQLPDGSLTTAYPYRTQTNYGDSTAYGYLRVALGDTSGDPLNPSWTVTTVNATPDFTFISGEDTFASTAWVGGSLRVYYITPYSRILDGQNNRDAKLWRSTYSGSWGTPEIWFTPPGDPDAMSFPAGLFSFALVRDFTNDVGIVIDGNAEVSGVPYEYAAYDGPPIGGRYTYAHSPGQTRGRIVKT